MERSSIPLVAVTGGLLLGGSSTFLVNLGRAFRERGTQLPIVSLDEQNEHKADFAAIGVPVTLVSRRTHIYEDRLRLAYEALARWRPRAVLACLGGESFEVLRLVPPDVARLGIIQSDDPGPYQTVQLYSDCLDAVAGVSSAICQRARSFPEAAPRRVELIPYGIWFSEQQKRVLSKPDEPVRIIYVGRIIEEQKRVSRLVELAKLLHSRQVNFQFTIVGSGPQLPLVKSALNNVPGVEIRGELPNQSIAPLLAAQDILVLLSDYEGLPLSLLEAMGAGVVPVVSDLESGIRDVVNEETGLRVPIGDVSAAADAIAALASDRTRLASLSAGASRLVRESYSAERMAARYLQLVDELAPSEVSWPSTTRVSVPLQIKHPWLYDGAPRVARRWIKRFLAAPRGSSTQS